MQRFRGTTDWWDPEFVDYLAADHDVIVFDNVGIGYSTGEPRDSLDGFAEGVIEFIAALGLATVDLLGWSLPASSPKQSRIAAPIWCARSSSQAAVQWAQCRGNPR